MRGRQDFANDEGLDNGRSFDRLSFERFSQPIAFPELSNGPPLPRSCQDGNDEISLDSASYDGPAIASCDGSRIHGDADRGDSDCAEKNEMSSHLLCGALSSRCLKATRSECSGSSAIENRMGETRRATISNRVRCSGQVVILVLGLSLVVQAATQNPKARETDRQDTRDHNGGGRHAAGVQASLSVRARRGLIQILEAIPAARRCRGVNGRSPFRSNS